MLNAGAINDVGFNAAVIGPVDMLMFIESINITVRSDPTNWGLTLPDGAYVTTPVALPLLYALAASTTVSDHLALPVFVDTSLTDTAVLTDRFALHLANLFDESISPTDDLSTAIKAVLATALVARMSTPLEMPYVAETPLTEALTATGAEQWRFPTELADTADVTESLTYTDKYRPRETTALADGGSTIVSFATLLLEALVLRDVQGSIAAMTLEEAATLADALSEAIQAQLTLPETTALLDELTSSLFVHVRAVEAARVADALLTTVDATQMAGVMTRLAEVASLGLTYPMVETVSTDLTDAVRLGVAARSALADQAGLADVSTLTAALTALFGETLNWTTLAELPIQTLLALSDGSAFIAKVPLEDGDYSAWVMNADTLGATSYTNFPFNSLATHRGVPYGLTETGLYELDGEDDDGTPIAARIATGDLNFSSNRDKNVPRAYLHITQSGNMVLKTITSKQGSRHETYYELTARQTDGDGDLTFRRVPLGRGVRGVWWRFEIHNVDGADFELDGAEILPVILNRRG